MAKMMLNCLICLKWLMWKIRWQYNRVRKCLWKTYSEKQIKALNTLKKNNFWIRKLFSLTFISHLFRFLENCPQTLFLFWFWILICRICLKPHGANFQIITRGFNCVDTTMGSTQFFIQKFWLKLHFIFLIAKQFKSRNYKWFLANISCKNWPPAQFLSNFPKIRQLPK